MTIKQKPGNQPDPSDMSGRLDGTAPIDTPPISHPAPEEAEDEAAKLGDFA